MAFTRRKTARPQSLYRKPQRGLLWRISEKFSKCSSIHGLQHIFARSTGHLDRFLWCFCFLLCLLLLIYTDVLIADRYKKDNFKTIIADLYRPIGKIPFPEVTVCNENRLNWRRLPQAKKMFLRPEHRNTSVEQMFTDVVAAYDLLTFGNFSGFSQFAAMPLHLLDYVSFTMVAKYMAWRCDELVDDCQWGMDPFDCCEYFKPRRSQAGICLSFASPNGDVERHGTEENFAKRTFRVGPQIPFTFTIHIRQNQHRPQSNNKKGAQIMITEPHVWYAYPAFVAANSRATMQLDALYMYHDEQTRSVPASVRRCIFENELSNPDYKTFPGRKYMIENCQSKCQQRYTMLYCNCSIDLFFPRESLPICKAKHLPCLAAHNDDLQKFKQDDELRFVRNLGKEPVMLCECLHNCDYLRYKASLHQNTMAEEEIDNNDSLIGFKIYFKRDNVIVYRTQLIHTWADLLVSFGGIAGLFLGCSVISLVEICYFLLMEVPQSVCQEYRQRKKQLKSRGVRIILVQSKQ